jgi:ribonuclease VapC
LIVVDTSALMAVLNEEAAASRCASFMAAETELLLSAGTMAEAMVVSAIRGYGAQMADLVERLGFEIVPVTAPVAHRMAGTYQKWGKGMNPAGLNFGDCFAYELAQ